MANNKEMLTTVSKTGIRSETDRCMTNDYASRRKGCAPTRTSVKGTTVPNPIKKKPTHLIGFQNQGE